tara:strand:+ start:1500 stop:2690 length:1191 start_codon:yes stop_codon:yes gene_type:complete
VFFQTFDDKQNCLAVYLSGKFHFNGAPHNSMLTKTWSYSEVLKDKEIEYAKLYCAGQSLDEACPDFLRKEWDGVKSRLEAFHRSVKESGLDLNEHCFFDMVPKFFLKDYAVVKNAICQHVFSSYEKPPNYDFLVELTKLLTEIKNRKLLVDFKELESQRCVLKVRNFIKHNKKSPPYVVYDSFKTKTGRLVTKNSFPILTMDKNYRKILKPNNDWFIEFDFNAAELRVLLGLLGKEQPQEDLHEWNRKNIYKGSIVREEAKKRIFAWLYNPASQDHLLNKVYDRKKLLEKHWDGSKVNTYYDRMIESDRHHALNYLIQSSAADLFLRQAIKVRKLLQEKESSIAFMLHDSIVIDFSEKDMKEIRLIKETFAKTDMGNFLVNVTAGKDFGSLQRIKI